MTALRTIRATDNCPIRSRERKALLAGAGDRSPARRPRRFRRTLIGAARSNTLDRR
jgi:hypothetical protein